MSRITTATELTLATPCIDLTDNALTVFNNTNKLVPDRPIKPRIPTRDLEVGITNPGQRHTHDRLISTIRLLYVFN